MRCDLKTLLLIIPHFRIGQNREVNFAPILCSLSAPKLGGSDLEYISSIEFYTKKKCGDRIFDMKYSTVTKIDCALDCDHFNLCDAPSAQDNLSKLLTALST